MQKICTECGDPFTASQSTAKTCSGSCRTKRSKRRKNGDTREFAVDVSPTLEAMEAAANAAIADLPQVAREVLAEELRPAVREALTGNVLSSIGDMVELLPLVQNALRDDLEAVRCVTREDGSILYKPDGTPYLTVDSDRRAKAVAIVLKYTVGQPGLAPQPETPEQAPMVVVFPHMPAPPSHIEGSANEEIQLDEGERLCDMCEAVKPEDEFVGSSNRCTECHEGARVRIAAAIEERTGRKD